MCKGPFERFRQVKPGRGTIVSRAKPKLIDVTQADDTDCPRVPVNLAMSEGFRSHELTKVRALVIEHRALFLEKWNEYFGA
jgi:hypothetical protein